MRPTHDRSSESRYAGRMHILIINFNLNDITRSEYEAVCAEVAPEFAAIPGLVSK